MSSVVRTYCRGCVSDGHRFVFRGFATGAGDENHARPRAEIRSCGDCGLLTLALADVNDAEGLARAVLDKWMRLNAAGRATATGKPAGVGDLDAEELLAGLLSQLWRLYLSWNPAKIGRFASYASYWLPQRLKYLVADLTGAPYKTRVSPKPHAFGLSESLERLYFAGDYGEEKPLGTRDQRFLEQQGTLGDFTADAALDRVATHDGLFD